MGLAPETVVAYPRLLRRSVASLGRGHWLHARASVGRAAAAVDSTARPEDNYSSRSADPHPGNCCCRAYTRN